MISAVIGLLWPIFEFLWLIGRQIIIQHHVVWKDATADYLTNYIFAVIVIFIGLVIDIHRDGIIADYLDFRKKKR
ncbi:hypothetical protein FC39_GL000869 [Lactobacillus hamsteri DSM 5661 = JCM 6256]|uniref:Uncharacterized protein n=1 Tax=Lactobacillus hamsteri DSM 5661 = JCM 6256 TaxID=1423754 RepID=A0A0R1YGS6_9LACO|nr:hypothetical protein FC39_GL000869 [Lactobacillus hamsteri DSM 5661 = JCM 6256]